MASYPELEDRVVLVTGAGRGIGRGIALAFAEHGARVLVNDLTDEHARETVEAVRATGAVADAVPADVADRAAVRAMVSAAVERHGEIDALVNNAGINVVSPFLELSDDVWERTQRIHHWGLFYCAQEVAPRVVASLWRIDDRATAELMTRFYRGMLKDGLRPAAALRAAQVSMWKDNRWSGPHYWAAFTIQGEWK